jgi:DNA-directed RNA polymerase subunit RPC12/RpoP
MSVAYRCNRCAALFDPNDPRSSISAAPMELRGMPLKRPKDIEVASIALHLCETCSAAFQRFLQRKPDPTFGAD